MSERPREMYGAYTDPKGGSVSDSITAWHEYHEQQSGQPQPAATPPAPDRARVVTVNRAYYFAAGQHHFYAPRKEIVYSSPGAMLASTGEVAVYPADELRAFAEGTAHEPPPLDVLRVIVYEWLRGGGL